MRTLFFTLFFSALFFACVNAQADKETPRFYAEASAGELQPGATVQIDFVLENGNGGKFIPPDWDAAGFELLGGPSQSSSVSIVNGVRHSEFRYTYLVQPRDTGQVFVPSATIQNGETELKTEPLPLTVSGDAPPSTWRRSPAPGKKEKPVDIPLKSKRPTVRI
jgi:hypothetical protein